MKALVFYSILVAAILFLLGWILISYWQKCMIERKRRQKLLEELAPWLKRLKQMDDKEFEKEFKRILALWMEAKEAAKTLQLQFDLVCEEDGKRREAKHRMQHQSFFKRIQRRLRTS